MKKHKHYICIDCAIELEKENLGWEKMAREAANIIIEMKTELGKFNGHNFCVGYYWHKCDSLRWPARLLLRKRKCCKKKLY